jgi:Tol biopolymer transport system component
MRNFNPAAVTVVIATCALAWETPVNLGETVNTGYNEWYPVLAEDGSFMVFVSDRVEGMGGMDIWISYWTGTGWDVPQNIGSNVNTSYDESAPFLAEDDTKLYFLSTDPAGFGAGDIWFCDLTGGVTGPKTNLGTPVNGPYYDCCPALTHSGDRFYICSDRPGGVGGIDIWISEWTGAGWDIPFNAGMAVNTTGSDCPRWISDSDEDVVIVSTGPGGYGYADLYFTSTSGDSLGPRTNFGSVINTPYAELGSGFLDNSGVIGGTMFFGSGRPGGSGQWDIWYSLDTGSLESLTWGGVKKAFTEGACPCSGEQTR